MTAISSQTLKYTTPKKVDVGINTSQLYPTPRHATQPTQDTSDCKSSWDSLSSLDTKNLDSIFDVPADHVIGTQIAGAGIKDPDELSDVGFEVNVEKATDIKIGSSEVYKMTAKVRGICLIINNVKFNNDFFCYRRGSDVDVHCFRQIFEQLGFVVKEERNCTRDHMRATFKDVAQKLCSFEHNALVVIILSHGTESGVYSTDNAEVEMEEILTYFDNKSCPAMMRKPKLFIVQACRGRTVDYGARNLMLSQPSVPQTQPFGSQSWTQPSQFTQIKTQPPLRHSWAEYDSSQGLPTRSDMILVFSCQLGHVSTRNEDQGSWLGRSLCQHLEKEACRHEFINIMRMVSRDLSSRISQDGYKQIVEINMIGFERELYFNPGYYDTSDDETLTTNQTLTQSCPNTPKYTKTPSEIHVSSQPTQPLGL